MINKRENCELTDPRFIPINTINETQFYKINNMSDLPQKLD